jgi:carbamoyl-phosphate synthase/aspartate carbamoyltransferase
MSIGRTFEEAIQKAIRSIDPGNLGFNETTALMKIEEELQTPSDQRLFAIANAMRSGYTVDKIWELTQIDKWFLSRLKGLSDFENLMSTYTTASITKPLIKQAKQLGYADRQLAKFWGSNELAVRRTRIDAGIFPVVKQIVRKPIPKTLCQVASSFEDTTYCLGTGRSNIDKPHFDSRKFADFLPRSLGYCSCRI